jgi:hypothetical protein
MWSAVAERSADTALHECSKKEQVQRVYVARIAKRRGASLPAALHKLPVGAYVIVITQVQLVRFKIVNRFDLCRCGGPFEPSRGAPGILIGNCYQPMPNRVVMNIVQASTIGFLIGQPRLPKIMPDLLTRGTLKSVDPFGSSFVKPSQHNSKAACMLGANGTVRDEMIVIGEHGPGFELPARRLRDL